MTYVIGARIAKEQGIMKRGVYFQRFWRHHYFDWILWTKKSVIYAGFGGVALGTMLFGDLGLALDRCVDKYKTYISMKTQGHSDSEFAERIVL